MTANPSAETELESVNVHVDKYLTKDLRTDVLLAYVANLLEKTEIVLAKNVLTSKAEEVELNIRRRTVKKGTEELELTRKEFDILRYFLENKNVAISREELIQNLWNRPAENVAEKVIDVHIKMLRKKLQCYSIVSLRGFGYK